MGIVKEPTQTDFRLLADISVDVIYQLNLEGEITYCSPSVERMLGYTPEEVIGNNFSKFLSPTDISIATKAFQEVISGSVVENFEFHLLKKNKSFVPVEFSAIPVFSNGKISSIQGICRNISERRQAADEILSLKESEFRNRQIIENIRDIIFTLSAEGNITSLNPAFEKITGWSPNEFIDKLFTTMIHHDDIPSALRAFESISRGEIPSKSEVRLKTKTGAYSIIEGKVTPQFEQGKIIGYFGIARDITERKQIEEELRESELKFRLLSEQSFMAICLIQDHRVKYVNQAFIDLVGFSYEEVLSWTRTEYLRYIHPDDLAFVREQGLKKQTGETNGVVPNYSFRFITQTGDIRWVEVFSKTIESQGRPADFISFIDITERKQTEEKLLESEAQNRYILENVRDVIFTLSPDGTTASLSPEFEKITGWARAELIGKPFTEIAVPEDIPIAIEGFEATIRGESPPPYEGRVISKSGEILTFEVKAAPQIEDGKIIAFLGTARDITERKKAEKELIRTKKRLEYLLEECPAIIYSCTPGGHFEITFMSENIKKILGHQVDNFVNKPEFWERNIHPEDRERAITTFRELAKQEYFSSAYRFKHKNGSYRWMLEEANLIYDDNGDPLEIVGFWTDITERKMVEEKLRESEEQHRTLFENTPIGLYRSTPDHKFLAANPKFIQQLGLSSFKELCKINAEGLAAKRNYPRDRFLKEINEKGEVKGFESQFKRPDGTFTYIRENARAIKDSDGSILYYEGSVEDITDWVLAEKALRESEEQLRAFMESSPDYFALLDSELNYIEVNKVGLKALRETKENVIGKNILELAPFHKETGRYDEYLEVIRTGKPFFIKDLEPRPKFGDLHISLRAFKVGDGLGIIATDITELKQTEEALRDKEERLRSFMDAATDSFTLWDSELNLVDIDKTGLKTFFKDESRDSIIGRNILDFAGSSSYIEIYKDVLKTGNPFSGERPAPPSLFGNLILSVKAFKVGDDLGIITTDITERKKMEDELRENEEKFRSIFENAPIGMALTDLDFRFSKTNTVFCQMLGYSTHELAELSFPDITHPDYHRKDVEYNKKLEQDEISTYQTDKRYLMKDGKLFWGRTTVSLLRTDKGAPSYYLAMIEDITALKQKEEELKSQLLKYNLIDGNIYLIKENLPALSQTVFMDLLKVGYRGFVISRTPEREHRQGIEGDFDILHLNEKSNSEEIHKFIENAPHRSVFLIDRLEYLFITKGFDNAIQLLYKWSDIAYLNNLIILLSVDVSTFKEEEISVLEKETKRIEPKFMAKVSEEFLELLRFIYQQNNLGMKPSYSEIREELKTSRPTVRKRINRLATTGYLIESKKGNKKVLEITEKGRSLFQS